MVVYAVQPGTPPQPLRRRRLDASHIEKNMAASGEKSEGNNKLTIFLMTYNQEIYVREAIESLFGQVYEDLEILISDDCSSDKTYCIIEQVVSSYSGPHKVILNRNSINLGIMAHVNKIMELVSGDFVILAAGDDISEPERVARLAAAWIAGGGRVKGVHSSVQMIDEDGRPIGVKRPRPQITEWERADPMRIISSRANCTGASFGWARELFDHFGPLIPDRAGVEDGPIFFRAALLGDIVYLDEPLVRQRTGGLSARDSDHARPGDDHLYGHRIKALRWWRSGLRCFLADLDKVDRPDAELCRRTCRRELALAEAELSLVEASTPQRLRLMPEVLATAARHRSGRLARQGLKYLFEAPYRIFADLRHGDGR